MKIKLITGFREDQYYIIEAEEAHKAYYLFNNPEKRGVFNNGVAIIGKNIQGIEPAWQETMGWNPTHRMDSDDWNEINTKGIGEKLKDVLYEAKKTAQLLEKNPQYINMALTEVRTKLLV